MSDTLKGFLHVAAFNFTDGALPEATVFNNIFASVKSGFNELNNIIGPAIKNTATLENKNLILSSEVWGNLSGSQKTSWESYSHRLLLNTFNIARAIGSLSALNPTYVPGTTHLYTSQGAGYALSSNTLEQELPFFPTSSLGHAEVTGGGGPWNRKTSLVDVYEDNNNNYYIDSLTRTIYSNQFFNNGEVIKYDLVVGNEQSYIGSGYNVIPDLSILSLTNSQRTDGTGSGSDYGCVKVEFVSQDGIGSRWKLTLPKVISARESLYSNAKAGIGAPVARLTVIDNWGFLPVGKPIEATSERRYFINNTNESSVLYGGTFFEENTVVLYDSANNKSWNAKLERSLNANDWYIFYATLPYDAVTAIKNDSNSYIATSGGVNTKHFFLVLNQTTLSESIGQLAANYATHDHDGTNSHRVSHKDLLHTDSEMPVVGLGAGEYGGLDIAAYNRRYGKVFSDVPNDMHPQYLSKFGFRQGGSQGLYDRNPLRNNRDNNLFYGDFILGPIENTESSYIYSNTYDANISRNRITWDFISEPTNNLRGHALVFGYPKFDTDVSTVLYGLVYSVTVTGSGANARFNITLPTNTLSALYDEVPGLISIVVPGSGYAVNNYIKILGSSLGGHNPTNNLWLRVTSVNGSGGITGIAILSQAPALYNETNSCYYAYQHNKNFIQDNGAVKVYYEPFAFAYQDGAGAEYDSKVTQWNLARHGFILGDQTTNNNSKGLNIGWGNLFFGYRSDIFGGNPDVKSSATWLTSEFNVLSTGNGLAGTNTNSQVKSGYAYRDGISLKAIEGSNVWINAGGINPAGGFSSNDIKPSIIALEASKPGYSSESIDPDTKYNSGLRTSITYPHLSRGSGIFLSPSLSFNESAAAAPWVDSNTGNQAIASLWTNNELYTLPISGGTYESKAFTDNPILDILNLTIDYQAISVAPDATTGRTNSIEEIRPGVDNSLLGWIAGRPFVRGTYGINFCLSNNFDILAEEFQTGYLKRLDDNAWGYGRAVTRTTLSFRAANEYIHREFRFWGANSEKTLNPYSTTSKDAIGGNINLMYGFGKDYKRHGRLLNWKDTDLVGKDDSIWLNSRSISLGSSNPAVYGSAIRQASFVEAFEGFRSDPTQPFTAEYVFPFKVKIPIPSTPSETYSIPVHNRNIIITDTDISPEAPEKALYPSDTLYAAFENKISKAMNSFIDTTNVSAVRGNDLGLDSIIKGAEEIFFENSGGIQGDPYSQGYGESFPASLVSFDLDLDYFRAKEVGVDKNTVANTTSCQPHASTEESHDDDTYNLYRFNYLKIKNGTHIMVPGLQIDLGANNLFPVLKKAKSSAGLDFAQVRGIYGWRSPWNGINGDIAKSNSTEGQSLINQNKNNIMRYESFLTLFETSDSDYANFSQVKYPLFHNYLLENGIGTFKNFALCLNFVYPLETSKFDGPLEVYYDTYGKNLAVPYRVYRTKSVGSTMEALPGESLEVTAGLAVEITGRAIFKFLRASAGFAKG
jgi:hypothetical protein